MIVCTFPGKHGDLLWALPTVRAISETFGEPVTLVVSTYVKSLAPLLRRQSDYIYTCIVDEDWQVQQTAPMTPRLPPHAEYPEGTRVFHLGYEGWPEPNLPMDVYRRAVAQIPIELIDLRRPWITAPYPLQSSKICVGFTDEYFELKYGIYQLLRKRFEGGDEGPGLGLFNVINLSTSPRWEKEGGIEPTTWEFAASWLKSSELFVGCCSSLHVLAVAVGTPVVVVEPSEPRWQDLFYPCGKAGLQVQLLLGGDGRPTFDARHLWDTVQPCLAR